MSRPSEFSRIITTSDSDGTSLPGGNSEDAPPSVQEMRKKLSSSTVRLVSVEAVSSSSLRVTWKVLVEESTLEGVNVRYRPLDEKSQQPIGVLSVVSIHFPLRGERPTDTESFPSTGRKSPFTTSIPTSHIISNLRPSTSYEVFVVPFYRNVEGQPTSAMRRTTLPAPILVTPSGLHYRALNSSAVRVAWDPLPFTLDVGGRLKGYNVQVGNIIYMDLFPCGYILLAIVMMKLPYKFKVRVYRLTL